MTSADEFAKNFEPYAVPPELAKLLVFQQGIQTFEIIAFDAEPSVSHAGIFFDRDEPSGSEQHRDYVDWLAQLGLQPVENPGTLIAAAQAKHQAAFVAWLAQYYDENG